MNRTALTYVSDKLAKSITYVGDERAKTIHSRASRFEIGKLVFPMNALIADTRGKLFSTMGQYPSSNCRTLPKGRNQP
ncbi:MAG TPA: hypothetical protein VNZ03_16520 [Terriglobales bacterium]|jgi:hypothetical protein|nr:hypothetical protein [Terriglobales bacterium]